MLDSGVLYGPNAPETVELDREWAAYIGPLRVLTNSGTAARFTALWWAAGVRPGDDW